MANPIIDPNYYFTYGEGIVSSGFVVRDGINGVGLVTRGFIWQLYDIWVGREATDSLSTSWSNAEASLTTNWTNMDTGISTTWTDMQYGISGEYTP